MMVKGGYVRREYGPMMYGEDDKRRVRSENKVHENIDAS